jgi:hypothetical protein
MPANDYALKHCPCCGRSQNLVVYKDPNSPAEIVMCEDCGASAPVVSWNMRRQPLELLINPNPKVVIREAPEIPTE